MTDVGPNEIVSGFIYRHYIKVVENQVEGITCIAETIIKLEEVFKIKQSVIKCKTGIQITSYCEIIFIKCSYNLWYIKITTLKKKKKTA